MRHGYYVEGRYYANRWNQAVARAQFLANTYGRDVDVQELSPGVSTKRVRGTARPEQEAACAA